MSLPYKSIEFIYSPQRALRQLTSFRFNLGRGTLTIKTSQGQEKLIRDGTDCHMKFILDETGLDEEEIALVLPINHPYVQAKIEGDVLKLTLLKQYSCEHVHNPDITFPAAIQVADSLWDEELSVGKSCLTPIERMEYFGWIQVHELYNQFHNLLAQLKSELCLEHPSPITIRGLKTSLLLLTASHAETITNFVGSLALELNTHTSYLNNEQTELLSESRDLPRLKNTSTLKRFPAYVDSLYSAAAVHDQRPDTSRLSELLGRIFRKRNALLHVRTIESNLSISRVNQQVEITENDLVDLFVSLVSYERLLLLSLRQNIPSTTSRGLFNDYHQSGTAANLSDITGLLKEAIDDQINYVVPRFT